MSQVIQLADGRQWHSVCNKMQAKYGTDWSFPWGFDLRLVTQEEYNRLAHIHILVMRARGVTRPVNPPQLRATSAPTFG